MSTLSGPRLGETVKRRIWLTATTAALFTLQAPLCALACLESPETVSASASHHGAQPCHDDGAEPAPADRPRSHEHCGCALVIEARVVETSSCSTVSAAASITSPKVFSQPGGAIVRWAPSVPSSTDLPPPDLLLLKSSLII